MKMFICCKLNDINNFDFIPTFFLSVLDFLSNIIVIPIEMISWNYISFILNYNLFNHISLNKFQLQNVNHINFYDIPSLIFFKSIKTWSDLLTTILALFSSSRKFLVNYKILFDFPCGKKILWTNFLALRQGEYDRIKMGTVLPDKKDIFKSTERMRGSLIIRMTVIEIDLRIINEVFCYMISFSFDPISSIKRNWVMISDIGKKFLINYQHPENNKGKVLQLLFTNPWTWL